MAAKTKNIARSTKPSKGEENEMEDIAVASLSVVDVVDVAAINEASGCCCWSVGRGLVASTVNRDLEPGARGGGITDVNDTNAATEAARADDDDGGAKASIPVSTSSSSSDNSTATSAPILDPQSLYR
jgi:hypothetical protein